MAHPQEILVSTNFLGSIDELITEGRQVLPPNLEAVEPSADLKSAPGSGHDLADKPCRGRVDHWWIALPDSLFATLDPDHIVGAVLRNGRGSTSPIAGYDAHSRRVITRSGSVYELGMPETGFAARGRRVLRRLGF